MAAVTAAASAVSRRPAAVKAVVEAMEAIAPLKLAGSWDNVGLLVDSVREPASPVVVLLTNDLTDKVVDEAISAGAGVIVSYHPTPFGGLKKLVAENRSARIVLNCISNGIAVYSPHTALDCAVGGVNDWLAAGVLGVEFEPAKVTIGGGPSAGAGARGDMDPTDESFLHIPGVRPIKPSGFGAGEGRVVTLPSPVSLQTIVDRVKSHLKLEHVQVAIADSALPFERATSESVKKAAENVLVSTVGICAGSGRSVLGGTKADVWLTGEMSHHDCLAAASDGTSVIVTNHSNTERGFLPHLKSLLETLLGDSATVTVTTRDADPLVVV